ncbi:substrate-binding periplasmic protein [Kiloniella sp.]|uniref:substrate-binding periplasmic protein n=1 Tax=Kiloniella sp. TaxID=1938587 RepID=UPI003B029756
MCYKIPIDFQPLFIGSKPSIIIQKLFADTPKYNGFIPIFGCRKLLFPLSTFLLFICFLCLPIRGISASERVVLTTGYNYAPYTGEQLPQGGMVTEIITSLLNRIGLDPEYRRRPWKRALHEAELGKYLGTFPWEPRSELNEAFYYSDPIIVVDIRTYFDANTPDLPQSATDLKGMKICLPLGHRTYGLIGEMINDGDLLITSPNSMEKCFKQLKSGRVDMVSVSGVVARQYAKQVYGYVDGVQALGIASSRTTFHMLISKRYSGAQELMNRLNAELEFMRAENTLAPIIERHLWVR